MQRVWEGTFLSRPAIIKQRFSKKYRHPQLDVKLTAARLKSVRWQGRHLQTLHFTPADGAGHAGMQCPKRG